MSEDFKPEDMPIIEIDMSKVRQYKSMDELTEQAQELGLYEIDLLATCGRFETEDCISHEDMRHLFKRKCQECKIGEMRELSIYDDWEGMLTCDKCGNRSKK